MAEHYDALETRTQQARETAWMQALPVQVAHAQVHAPAFVSSLAGVKADEVNSLAALARLPVVRKQELMDMQKAARAGGGDVFGGFSTLGFGPHMPRVFASPMEGSSSNTMVGLAIKARPIAHICCSPPDV